MAKPGVLATGQIEIQISGQQLLTLPAPGAEGYILGRSDANSKYVPDIDLADWDALNKGVSRRHAALVSYAGIVHIIDLNSVNGTYLNDERLAANEPYALSVNDHVLLGTLELRVSQTAD